MGNQLADVADPSAPGCYRDAVAVCPGQRLGDILGGSREDHHIRLMGRAFHLSPA